jgi:UPF0271 protein
LSCAALFTSIKKQIKTLQDVLEAEHRLLHHIKPHGALYNLAAVDIKIANVIVEVMKSLVLHIKLYVPYKSVIAEVALKNNIEITYEAFADRNYNDDLTLVSRKEKNALITDSDNMFEHVYNMVSKQKVKTIQNSEVEILAKTYCIHGDNPNAVILIKSLKEKLELNGINIR